MKFALNKGLKAAVLFAKAGTTYFVDPAGSDSNLGTSLAAPWQTVAKVNASTFKPGDKVLFKAGSTWRESLIVPSSGISGRPITFSKYGDGALPTLTGANLKANVDFTSTSGIVYQASFTLPATCVMMVWEDGIRLVAKTSVATVQATPGSYWLSGTTLYVSASDGSNVATSGKTYEVCARTFGVKNEKNYIVIRDINAINCWGDDTTYGCFEIGGYSNQLYNLAGSGARRHAFQYTCRATSNCVNNAVSDSTFTDCVDYLVSVFASNDAGSITSGNTLRRLTLTNNSAAGGGLITVHGVNSSFMPSNTTIEHCDMSGGYKTTGDQISIYLASGVVLSKNYIHGVMTGYPIRSSNAATTGVQIIGNIIDLSGTNASYEGIFTQDHGGTIVVQNTFIGPSGKQAARFYSNAFNGTFKNNIISGCAKVLNVDATSQTGFTSDCNDAYNITSGVSAWAKWGATEYSLADWKTNSSQDAHTVTGDPAFVGAGDYRIGATSAARGAGVAWWSGTAPTDYLGQAFASPPSIGAYEYHV